MSTPTHIEAKAGMSTARWKYDMENTRTPATYKTREGDIIAVTHPRDLSPAESGRAEIWASYEPGGQRYDSVLLEAMLDKRSRTGLATRTPPSPSLRQPSIGACSITGGQKIPTQPESQVAAGIVEEDDKEDDEEAGEEPWEAAASASIIKKNLSLNLVWNTKTWNMKSSRVARLKLLKDDGYDIRHLQAPGTTSDDITQAVLAHITTRTQLAPVQASSANLAVAGPSTAILRPSAAVAGPLPSQMGIPDEGKEQPDVLRSTKAKAKGPMYALPAIVPRKRGQDTTEEGLVDSKLFSGEWSLPEPSHDQFLPSSKRQRTSRTSHCTDLDRAEVLQVVKRKARREVFRESQLKAAKAKELEMAAKANALELTEDLQPVKTTEAGPSRATEPQMAQIVFAAYNPSPEPREVPVGYIGTRGMNAIMSELKFLGGASKDEDFFLLQIPESGEHNASKCIRILQDQHQNIAFEGNLLDLSGLLRCLGTTDLAHQTDWECDGITVVRKSGFPWALSDRTLGLLADVERLLRQEADRDAGSEGVVVRVEQIYDGKNLVSS